MTKINFHIDTPDRLHHIEGKADAAGLRYLMERLNPADPRVTHPVWFRADENTPENNRVVLSLSAQYGMPRVRIVVNEARN